jgi:hypothetical protein
VSEDRERPLTEGHQQGSRGWSQKVEQPGGGKGFQGQQDDEGGAPPPIAEIPPDDADAE